MTLPAKYHEANKDVLQDAKHIKDLEAKVKRLETERDKHKVAWRKESEDVKKSAQAFKETIRVDGLIQETNVALAQARNDRVRDERKREQALRESWFSWRSEKARLVAKLDSPKNARAVTTNTADFSEKRKAVAALEEIEKELERLGVKM